MKASVIGSGITAGERLQFEVIMVVLTYQEYAPKARWDGAETAELGPTDGRARADESVGNNGGRPRPFLRSGPQGMRN